MQYVTSILQPSSTDVKVHRHHMETHLNNANGYVFFELPRISLSHSVCVGDPGLWVSTISAQRRSQWSGGGDCEKRTTGKIGWQVSHTNVMVEHLCKVHILLVTIPFFAVVMSRMWQCTHWATTMMQPKVLACVNERVAKLFTV